jgi:excisionase family DNA binding protein
MAKFVKASDPAAPQFSAAASFTCSLLTVEEVAELLKVPVSWVYEHTRKRGLDRIPGFRLGKYWRFAVTPTKCKMSW